MSIDWRFCESLAEQAAARVPGAWQALVEHLWPTWVHMVRFHRSMGPLRDSEDQVHDIMAALIERIGARDGGNLDLFVSWRQDHAGKTFQDWLHIVTANQVRDHRRRQKGAGLDPLAAAAPEVKRLLGDFASSPAVDDLGRRPPMTLAQTARELLEYAKAHLPVMQLGALSHWIHGVTFGEIDDVLELEAGDGERLVRAAIAVLRRKFRVD